MYRTRMLAGWGDMDFNSHMRNTAYLDKAADSRMLFFAAHSFPMQEFMRLRIGPVVMQDELRYFREIGLLQEFEVGLELSAMSEDGSRFAMRNTFLLAQDKIAAQLSSQIGWLDLAARKLIAPPPALLDALQALPRSADFQTLPSSLKE